MGRFWSFVEEASWAVDHYLDFTKENLRRASKESIAIIKPRENKGEASVNQAKTWPVQFSSNWYLTHDIFLVHLSLGNKVVSVCLEKPICKPVPYTTFFLFLCLFLFNPKDRTLSLPSNSIINKSCVLTELPPAEIVREIWRRDWGEGRRACWQGHWFRQLSPVLPPAGQTCPWPLEWSWHSHSSPSGTVPGHDQKELMYY